jgi:hypothetical protein
MLEPPIKFVTIIPRLEFIIAQGSLPSLNISLS